MERDREEPLLAAAANPAADVEEGAGHLAALDDLDRALLLDDVQRRRVAGRRRDVDGRREAARDLLERECVRRVAAAGRRTRAEAEREGGRRNEEQSEAVPAHEG